MKVSADPRKLWVWIRGATMAMRNIPKKSIRTKFTVLPRKSPSSRSRQYRTWIICMCSLCVRMVVQLMCSIVLYCIQ